MPKAQIIQQFFLINTELFELCVIYKVLNLPDSEELIDIVLGDLLDAAETEVHEVTDEA